ncbi:MAG: hypothetical protein AB7Q29_01585 [Vicinamibacterales bacterium]
MKLLRFGGLLAAMLVLGAIVTPAASAQSQSSSITATDIQRLEDALLDAGRDVSDARAKDSARGSQLEKELEMLNDDTAYLRVKLRRNESVPRTEYFDLRDRIDDLRARARAPSAPSSGGTTAPARPTAARPGATGRVLPVGTEFDVRLQQSLSSATNLVEDRFEATTLVELSDESGRVLVPAGSTMRGVVSSVTKAGRLERTGRLTVAFDQITIGGRTHPMRATVTQALESEGIKGEAGRIGAGAGVGAIIGGILGGVKGALAGILIGGGGTIAATEGQDVELPAGTVLRVRLDSALDLR